MKQTGNMRKNDAPRTDQGSVAVLDGCGCLQSVAAPKIQATAVQFRAAKRAFVQHWNPRLAAFAHPSSKLSDWESVAESHDRVALKPYKLGVQCRKNMKKQNRAKVPLFWNEPEA